MTSNNTNEQTVLAALKTAEKKLAALPQHSLFEISAFVKPPHTCELVLQGVSVLLQPSKNKFEWANDKNMLKAKNPDFISRLNTFNKDTITDDQLTRLTTILSKDECQPPRVAQISLACHEICLWLRAVADYARFRRESIQSQN